MTQGGGGGGGGTTLKYSCGCKALIWLNMAGKRGKKGIGVRSKARLGPRKKRRSNQESKT